MTLRVMGFIPAASRWRFFLASYWDRCVTMIRRSSQSWSVLWISPDAAAFFAVPPERLP